MVSYHTRTATSTKHTSGAPIRTTLTSFIKKCTRHIHNINRQCTLNKTESIDLKYINDDAWAAGARAHKHDVCIHHMCQFRERLSRKHVDKSVKVFNVGDEFLIHCFKVNNHTSKCDCVC